MKKRLILIVICAMMSIIIGCKQEPSNNPVYEMFSSTFVDLGKHVYQDEFDNLSQNITSVANATTWQNETIYFKVAICNYADDHEISVTAPKLKNDEDTLNAQTSVHYIDTVNSTYIDNNQTIEKAVPDVVTNNDVATIKADEVKTVLIEINIPSKAKPGNYQGQIEITSSEGFSNSLEVNVKVVDIKLDTQNNLAFELWQYPNASARYYNDELFDDDHQEYLDSALSLYHQTGGNSVVVSIVDEPWGQQTYDAYPSMIKWIRLSDGTWYFDYTDFDKWIEICQNEKVCERIYAFSLLPKNNRLGFYDEALQADQALILEPGTQEYQDIYGLFLSSFVSHLDEHHLFDITYIAMDENKQEEIQSVLNLLNEYPNAQGEVLKSAVYFNYDPSTVSYLDDVDVIAVGESIVQDNPEAIKKIIAHRKGLGLETFMYTCTGHYPNSFTYSDPYESTYTMLYMRANIFDGFIRWAMDAYNEEPLVTSDDALYESGDTFLVYPGDNHQVYPSIRYLMLYRGLIDINKFDYLLANCTDEELIEKANEMLISFNSDNELISQVRQFEDIINELQTAYLDNH